MFRNEADTMFIYEFKFMKRGRKALQVNVSYSTWSKTTRPTVASTLQILHVSNRVPLYEWMSAEDVISRCPL